MTLFFQGAKITFFKFGVQNVWDDAGDSWKMYIFAAE